MPPHYPEMNEELTGFPCPRREFPTPEGPALFQLCRLGARPESAHLFTALFGAYFDGPAEDRRRALRFVFAAYGDEAVRAALWPKPPDQ